MIVHWFKTSGPPPNDPFVREVRVRTRQPVDRLVLIGWTLILLKCILASIAIRHWSIPIADFYVWGPSIIFGGVCTSLHLTRD